MDKAFLVYFLPDYPAFSMVTLFMGAKYLSIIQMALISQHQLSVELFLLPVIPFTFLLSKKILILLEISALTLSPQVLLPEVFQEVRWFFSTHMAPCIVCCHLLLSCLLPVDSKALNTSLGLSSLPRIVPCCGRHSVDR